jgi:hypothetical protein
VLNKYSRHSYVEIWIVVVSRMKRTGLGVMGFQFYYDLGSDIPLPNKLEVSATSGTHLHCSLPLLQDVECGVLIEQFRAC